MNEPDAVFARVVAAVRRTFNLPQGANIGPDTSSADVDGWDSLSHSMLIMEVEEDFAITLPLDRLYGLNDVGELATLVQSTLDHPKTD